MRTLTTDAGEHEDEHCNTFSDRATPTITGKDAERFLKRLQEVSEGKHRISPEEKARIKANYDLIMSKAKI